MFVSLSNRLASFLFPKPCLFYTVLALLELDISLVDSAEDRALSDLVLFILSGVCLNALLVWDLRAPLVYMCFILAGLSLASGLGWYPLSYLCTFRSVSLGPYEDDVPERCNFQIIVVLC